MNKGELAAVTETAAELLINWTPGRVFSNLHVPEPGIPCRDDRQAEWRRLHCESHNVREIMLVLRGEMSFRLNQRIYCGRAGDIAVFNPGDLHDRFFPDNPGAPLSLWYLPASGNCIVLEANGEQSKVLFSCRIADRELLDYSEKLWDSAGEKRRLLPVLETQLAHLLGIFTAELAGNLLLRAPGKTLVSQETNRQYRTIMAAVNFLSEHPDEAARIEFLAAKYHYSVSHFSRIFRFYCGCNFRDYLNRFRLNFYQSAKRQNLPLKTIAARLGFASASSLLHFLKSHKQDETERQD